VPEPGGARIVGAPTPTELWSSFVEPTLIGRRGTTPLAERHPADVLCLSHLRWNFVFQRPQHLLTRCAKNRRVFFFEEPTIEAGAPRLVVTRTAEHLWVAVPHLPEGLTVEQTHAALTSLIDQLIDEHDLQSYLLWYYTPMALPFTRHLEPSAIVYDCMDELSGFKGAPTEMGRRERELFARADVVFTGGMSLYEHKRAHHHNIHPFPSSVDVRHFAKARDPQADPDDQKDIPAMRIGFFGVIDERLDVDLVAEAAALRPDWHFVFVGPVVKIDPAILPRRNNVHFLGAKTYDQLPSYLAGWDVAMLPFARNDATRFISPTKTPEYLAAGKPVVSTSIQDVVRPYAALGLVRIADSASDFVEAIELALRDGSQPAWWKRVDDFLSAQSWDDTWARMDAHIDAVLASRVRSVAREHAETPAV
jgi:UDP-galactopyranose mutase